MSAATPHRRRATRRKLRVLDGIDWHHHRGGWRTAMKRLTGETHCDRGTPFIGCVEDHLMQFGPVCEPWVGVLHQVPRSTARYFPDLNRFIRTREWNQSAVACRGIWVLSEYARAYLKVLAVPVPIHVLLHPACTPKKAFSYQRFRNNCDKLILSIGHHQRRYEPFFELRTRGFRKMVLIGRDNMREPIRLLSRRRKVILRDRVSNRNYDDLLSSNLVFLNLIDASAVNTIVECAVRATPVLVNRHPAIIEYLGEEYPFYYRDVDEASAKLLSQALVLETTNYLRRLPWKDRLRIDAFVRELKASAIYESLPAPRRTQRTANTK